MLYRELTVATGNKLLPCCLYKEDIDVVGSVKETFYHGEFETLRQRMLSGERISACEQCYDKEALGLSSLRTESNTKWNNPQNVKLKVLELEFDNICNLKCRSCNSVHSHQWYNDENKIFGTSLLGKKHRQIDDYLSLDLSEIETLKFYGGEPFYSPMCKEFCTHLKKSTDVSRLEIVTFSNCTVLPSDEIYTILKECKSLYMILSIDGYGNFNDYFRHGSKWDKIVESLNFYTDLLKIRSGETELLVNTTVSVYNANLLQEFDSFMIKHYPHIKLQKSALTYPEYLSIANLPKEYKVKLESYLQSYPDILTYMNQEGNSKMFDYFLYFHHSLDQLRNEKLENNLLNDFIKLYNCNITKEDMKVLIESYVQN
jgi:organic radical activating enzyme